MQLVSARLTRRAYDLTAPFYPLSSLLFHRRAHGRLMELAGPLEGRCVLEVATGSGELFRRLRDRNGHGLTVGFDLSPGMVAMVKRTLNGFHGKNGGNPRGRYALQAVDARQMPFRDGFFDALFNCYLFELLPEQDILLVLREFRRVLRPGGRLLLVNVSEERRGFNLIYGALSAVAPSYWGRQVAHFMPSLLARSGFRLLHSEVITQTGYPSAVTVAERSPEAS